MPRSVHHALTVKPLSIRSRKIPCHCCNQYSCFLASISTLDTSPVLLAKTVTQLLQVSLLFHSFSAMDGPVSHLFSLIQEVLYAFD